jgi:lysine-specific permease
MGLLISIVSASFAFGGAELVGLCASDVTNPKKSVPKAIKGTFWGLCTMFVLSIMFMGLNINVSELKSDDDKLVSPFLIIFEKIGIPYADHFFNFICLVSVFSAANSSVYATARIVVGLAEEGSAPSFLLLKFRNGSPCIAVLLNIAFGALSYLTSVFGEGVVFQWLVLFSGLSAILSWICISVTHLRFRASFIAQGNNVADLPYKAFWHPYSDIFSITVLSFVVLFSCVIGFLPHGDIKASIGCIVAVSFMPILYFVHKLSTKTRSVSFIEFPLINSNLK